MLKLNNIGAPEGAHRDEKRRGRGRGSVSKKFESEVAKASKSAVVAVEAAGGSVTVKG